MLWLTWRQHRMQVLVTGALLAGLGIFLLVHGLGNTRVATGLAPGSDELEQALSARYRPVYQVLGWLPYVPLLIGIFWGAPMLAREYERGTHRLCWTQSVSRRRWLATKLVGLGVATALGGLAVAGMVTAWQSTFEGTRYADDLSLFTSSGVATAGWWVFAFALGAATGAVLRRMLPAMAVMIAVFVVTLMGLTFARYYYAEPERFVLASYDAVNPVAEGSYGARYSWMDPAGRELGTQEQAAAVERFCPVDRNDVGPCLYEHGYQTIVSYQPLNRYWRFQLTEAGLLLVGALALGALATRSALRNRA